MATATVTATAPQVRRKTLDNTYKYAGGIISVLAATRTS